MCIKTPIQISQFSNALKGTNESGRKKCLGRTMLNGICLRSKHSHNYLTSLYHFGKKMSFILLWFYCQHYSTYMYLNKTEQILNYNSLLKVLKITFWRTGFKLKIAMCQKWDESWQDAVSPWESIQKVIL